MLKTVIEHRKVPTDFHIIRSKDAKYTECSGCSFGSHSKTIETQNNFVLFFFITIYILHFFADRLRPIIV